MNVIRKDATITNTGADDDFPGTFEVVLSAPTLDRDGDTLLPEDWKQPLPDHITFDQDHAMSVAGTVGSGTPRLEDDGTLRVSGAYSSLPRAQEVRTLVNEGHIRTTSVAFMSTKSTKDGKQRVTRELLNGAFVAIPSNREALVLASKAAKSGARHSRADLEHVQAIHDHAIALGASAQFMDGDTETTEIGGKNIQAMIGVKTVAGSYEQTQQAICDALEGAYPDPANGYIYAYPVATFADSVVYRVSGDTDARGQWQCTYTANSDGTVSLGDPARVNMVETIQPVDGTVPKGFRLVPEGPENVGSSATADSVTSAKDAAAQSAAAAPEEGAAAAEEAAAAEADASEIHRRAVRIMANAALASLEGDI